MLTTKPARTFSFTINQALRQAVAQHKAGLCVEHSDVHALAADQPALETSIKVSSSDPANGSKIRKPVKSSRKSDARKRALPDIKEIDALLQLFSAGKYADVAIHAQAMTARFPLYGFGWKALGTSLRQLGRISESLDPMRQAAVLSPNDAELHSNLGIILKDLGMLNEAETSCRRALRIKPDSTEAHLNLGIIFQNMGLLKEAETSYKRALQTDAKCSEALHGLGHLYEANGQLDKANASYLQALKIKPDNLRTRYSLALATTAKTGDENFSALINAAGMLRNGGISLSDEETTMLHFALGKCYNDNGNYEQAFPHFLDGCQLKRATFNYNASHVSLQTAEIINIFDSDTIECLRGAGNPSQVPIFIVGMPRSGTTLIEQIIASHADVYGAGELPDLINIARKNIPGTASPVAFPGNLRSLDKTTLAAWGDEYVSRLKLRAPNARHITDKMPANYLAIGLIHLMLPNAKIIHVNRNPVDTCLSNFTQLFTDTVHAYTYDLTELGRYYVEYSRLMAHWRNVLPAGAFLDVNYEDIVTDQAAQTSRLIEYCGLEWSDSYLEFYKNKRWIHTASVVQARQPIYQSSVGRWRNYAKFLGPLLDALGELSSERL